MLEMCNTVNKIMAKCMLSRNVLMVVCVFLVNLIRLLNISSCRINFRLHFSFVRMLHLYYSIWSICVRIQYIHIIQINWKPFEMWIGHYLYYLLTRQVVWCTSPCLPYPIYLNHYFSHRILQLKLTKPLRQESSLPNYIMRLMTKRDM